MSYLVMGEYPGDIEWDVKSKDLKDLWGIEGYGYGIIVICLSPLPCSCSRNLWGGFGRMQAPHASTEKQLQRVQPHVLSLEMTYLNF